MAVSLLGLANKYGGEPIWVFGSGATLNFLDPAFFDDKVCVSTNFVGGKFGLNSYTTFTHYHADAELVAAERPDLLVVTVRRNFLTGHAWIDAPANVVLYDGLFEPTGPLFDVDGKHWPDDPDSLVFGSSSLHGSMHLAAYMGASHIVLVGADCGQLDGEHRFAEYEQCGDQPWAIYERDLRAMKAKLFAEYGCPVYSLNPFVNPSLEGHTYTGAVNIN